MLAGPLIADLTSDAVTFWLATSGDVAATNLNVQIWDPLPSGLTGFVADPTPQTGILAAFQSTSDLRTLKVADSLTVSLITVRAPLGGWPRNRALAYRIAIDATGWLSPPGGAEPLPGDPPAAVPQSQSPAAASVGSFPSAWFVFDAIGQQWAILALHGGSPATWSEAETYLNRASRGPKYALRPNTPGPNTPEGRPTQILMLAAGGAEVEPAFEGWVARNVLLGIASALAKELAHGLLLFSPALWKAVSDAKVIGVLASGQNNDGIRPVGATDAVALARLGSHAPIYAQRLQPPPSGVNADAAATAFAMLFNWGALGASAPPVRAYTELVVTDDLQLPGAPKLSVYATWPTAFGPTGVTRIPLSVVASPLPLIDPADTDGHLPEPTGSYDNLIALCAGPSASLITPKDQIDDKAHYSAKEQTFISRNPKSGTGEPVRRIYQLAICPGASRTPVPPLTRAGTPRIWNPNSLQYGDGTGTIPIAAATPTFAVVSSQTLGGRMGMRMTLLTDADHGASLALTHQGHRIVPRAAELAFGNRMRLEDPTDDHNLAGIDVLVDGTKRGVTDRDGLAIGVMATLVPGEHDLTVGGSLIRDGNPGPNTASPLPRLWRRRTFRILVVGAQGSQRIVKVDEEQVASAGVQILIDPIWMKLVSGVSQHPNRPQPVSAVVVHRTDGYDGRHTLTTWQKTSRQRQAEGETQKQSVTAAAYLLARDGTLVKGAADAIVVNHAAGRWGPRSGNPPKAPDSQLIAVGIEMSKSHEELGPYTEAQYAHLLWLLGQYVSVVAVPPNNIVGHGDVRVDGKDDPGLEFEWSRLEALGFGFRRALPAEGGVAPVTTPVPGYPPDVTFLDPASQTARRATNSFAASIASDLAQFETLFASEITGKSPSAAQAAVKVATLNSIESIGYSQQNADTERDSFRSHVFSGARRLFYSLKATGAHERVVDEDKGATGFGDPESPVTRTQLDKLLAVYARLIAAQLKNASPLVPTAPPEPPAPR